MFREEDINKGACEQLLKSAQNLIADACSVAPGHIARSTAFQDIQSLINEFSALKVNTSRESVSDLNPITDDRHSITDEDVDEDQLTLRYRAWVDKHWLTENQAELMAERMSLKWTSVPTVALFVIHREGFDALLTDTIESLKNQLYKNWSLTVISNVDRAECLSDISVVDNWIHCEDSHRGLNQSMLAASSDWLALLRCGDRLAIHGLFSLADYDNLRGDEWRVIYSDEDYIDKDGERSNPLFKPDINIDYLRSYPYIGRLCFFRKSLLLTIGVLPKELSCYNEELVLRTLEVHGDSAVGHIADVLNHRCGNSDDHLVNIKEEVWRNIVQEHLQRSHIDAEVTEGYLAKTNRVLYHYSGEPLITVIIPTKDRPDLIEPCVRSLFEVTEYKNFELIIIDNGSQSEDVFYYYEQWQKSYGQRIQIISYDKPFNFSAMNNYAEKHANGEYLVLLNNDTEIINGTWMERMLSHASRPGIGAVGARLLFPDGRLQHAGVVVGLADSASHPGCGDDFNKPGYMGRYQVDQNFNAVTAACLMVSRGKYNEVGGLNEDTFKVLFNDVDFCLELKGKGYRNVWTPYATLVHKHSASLKQQAHDDEAIKRNANECANFIDRWRSEVRSDFAFNRNLSFHSSDYTVDAGFSPSWNVDFSMRPKIYSLPQDYFGCGNYRVCQPLSALRDASIAEVFIGPRQDIYKGYPPIPTITDIVRSAPDCLYMQLTTSDVHIKWVEQCRRNANAFMVVDIDDLKTDLPDKNCNKRFVSKDVRSRLRRYLANFDRLTVSTQPLAESYRHLVSDVVVVPNRLDSALWGGLVSNRCSGAKPRVGWVGAQQHQGDLEIIAEVVKQTAHEIDWVFMGMCLDELEPYVKEIHGFEVNFADYPIKMASLNLDLALAPLEVHPFNEAKSNLRLLEYGMLGWPVVCTDIYPYQNAPVKRVNNTTAEWLTAIRERIYDLDNTAREGDILRDWVLNNWILQDHLDEWMHHLLPMENERFPVRIA